MRKLLLIFIPLFITSCSTSNKATESEKNPYSIKPVKECEGEIVLPQVQNYREARRLMSYPAELRKNGVEGFVFMSFEINETGKVNSVTTLSSPDRRLSGISEQVIKSLEFRPGMCDSTAVSFIGATSHSYRLSRL